MTAAKQSQVGKLVSAAATSRPDVVHFKVVRALAASVRAGIPVRAPSLIAHPDEAPNGLRDCVRDCLRNHLTNPGSRVGVLHFMRMK